MFSEVCVYTSIFIKYILKGRALTLGKAVTKARAIRHEDSRVLSQIYSICVSI